MSCASKAVLRLEFSNNAVISDSYRIIEIHTLYKTGAAGMKYHLQLRPALLESRGNLKG